MINAERGLGNGEGASARDLILRAGIGSLASPREVVGKVEGEPVVVMKGDPPESVFGAAYLSGSTPASAVYVISPMPPINLGEL
jgi:hypothetical protein